MRTAIIVDDTKNSSLLRFTQTKLFFNEHNRMTHMFDHCETVPTYEEAMRIAKGNDIVLEVGEVLSQEFIDEHRDITEIVYTRDQNGVIKFDKQVPMDRKSIMTQILEAENDQKKILLSKILLMHQSSQNRIYLKQTEQPNIPYHEECKHFYGLASGWKSMMHCVKHDYETYTIYDNCEPQLELAEALQSQMSLPEKLEVENANALWNPPQEVKDNWHIWHSMNVKFEKINLLDNPIFPKHSLVWISSVFNWEPHLYEHGYDKLKYLEKQLAENNSECILIKQEGIKHG